MKMLNARQAVHDAFAIHLTQPNRQDPGHGTKFDSNRAIFNGMKAGLIIKAVLDQSPYLRGAALLINAPDGTANLQEIVSFKAKLDTDFLKRSGLPPREAGEVMAISDHLISGHRIRVWDHHSERMTPMGLAKQLSSNSKVIHRIAVNANAYLDILTSIDNRSLGPVWKVINDQKDKAREAADPVAETSSALR